MNDGPKYAGQKLVAQRIERAAERARKAKPRKKKTFSKLDIMILKLKQAQAQELVKEDQFKLELPGGSVELMASSDANAVVKAKAYLREHGITATGLKLFRYPKEWVNKPTRGLIEIPLYTLKP